MEKENWVSVDERLPMQWQDVIVYDDEDSECLVAYRDDENKWVVPGLGDCEFSITHWMPLPEPPKSN